MSINCIHEDFVDDICHQHHIKKKHACKCKSHLENEWMPKLHILECKCLIQCQCDVLKIRDFHFRCSHFKQPKIKKVPVCKKRICKVHCKCIRHCFKECTDMKKHDHFLEDGHFDHDPCCEQKHLQKRKCKKYCQCKKRHSCEKKCCKQKKRLCWDKDY